MTALGNRRFASAPDTAIVAVSSLATVLGLVAMIAGRPDGTEAAQGAADEHGRTIAMEVFRAQPQLVAREGRADRFGRSKPLAERKTDRLSERAAVLLEIVPRAAEMFPTLAPDPSGDSFIALWQLAP
jgi:hypothetical protein